MLCATQVVVTVKYIPARQSSCLQAEAGVTEAQDSSQPCQNWWTCSQQPPPPLTGQTDISRGHHSGYREAKRCGQTCFHSRNGQFTSSGFYGSTSSFSPWPIGFPSLLCTSALSKICMWLSKDAIWKPGQLTKCCALGQAQKREPWQQRATRGG